MKRITSLFTIVCAASQLYGMNQTSYKPLSQENIKTALSDLDKTKHIDNLKDFTKELHGLANKFNTFPVVVAKLAKPNTNLGHLAEQYAKLNRKLLELTRWLYEDNAFNAIVQLIEQDADVNFIDEHGSTPLENARLILSIELVNLLLDSGAKPTEKDLSEALRVEDFWKQNDSESAEIAMDIRKILEEASKK